MHKSNKILSTFVIVAVLLQLFGTTALASRAVAPGSNVSVVSAEGEPSCWPLDVVIAVDQSYSMFGNDVWADIKPSDPSGYRFEAAKGVLNELIKNRQTRCGQATHRFALITFGTKAITYVPMQQIDLSPAADAKTWADPLIEKIDSASMDLSQNGTDFKDAFETIRNIFATAPELPAPEGYGPRRQIVIVITDGLPDISGWSSDDFVNYTCDFSKSFEDSFWDKKHVWFVALSAGKPYLDTPSCNNGTIRGDFQSIAEKHNGELKALEYNQQAIPAFISDIVSKEFGSTGVPIACEQAFYVDPYTQRVEFRFFRQIEDTHTVTLEKLNNGTMTSMYSATGTLNAAKEYTSEFLPAPPANEMMISSYYFDTQGVEERYVIDNPLAGAWQFRIDGQDQYTCQRSIDARKYGFLANVKVPQSNAILPVVPDAPYYDSEENKFQLQLRNSNNGKPIENNPDFPIDIQLTWTLPSGASAFPDGSPTQEKLVPLEGGNWVSAHPVLTPEEGTYKYHLVGTAPSGDKSKNIEVFNVTGSFEVKQIESLMFNIISPDPTLPLPCNKYTQAGSVNEPLTVTLQMVDKAGNPLDPQGLMLSDLNNSFEAYVMDAAGTNLETKALRSIGGGKFEGTLFGNAGPEQYCGDFTITAEFKGALKDDKYAFRKMSDSITIQRTHASGILAKFISPNNGADVSRYAWVMDACSAAKITPIVVEVELTDASSSSVIHPGTVQFAPDSVLYTVKVQANGQEEIIPLLPAEDGSAKLVGYAGKELTEKGTYKLTLVPNPQGFMPGYTYSQESADPESVTIERTDSWFTNPLMCGVITTIEILLLIAFLAFLVYAFTGGPGGRIRFLDETGNEKYSLGLSTFRLLTWFPIRNASLSAIGLRQVKASASKPTMKGERSILLQVIDLNKEVIFYTELETGMPLPLTIDMSVEYTHPKATGSGQIF